MDGLAAVALTAWVAVAVRAMMGVSGNCCFRMPAAQQGRWVSRQVMNIRRRLAVSEVGGCSTFQRGRKQDAQPGSGAQHGLGLGLHG